MDAGGTGDTCAFASSAVAGASLAGEGSLVEEGPSGALLAGHGGEVEEGRRIARGPAATTIVHERNL